MLLTDLYHYYTAPSTAHYVILYLSKEISHPRRYKAMLYRDGDDCLCRTAAVYPLQLLPCSILLPYTPPFQDKQKIARPCVSLYCTCM